MTKVGISLDSREYTVFSLRRVRDLIKYALNEASAEGMEIDSADIIEFTDKYAEIAILSEEGEAVGEGIDRAVVHFGQTDKEIIGRIMAGCRTASGANERAFRSTVRRAVRSCNEERPEHSAAVIEAAGRIIHGAFARS
ncbi:hypothetical protein GCM10027347_44280 [Larkinella harenae]